MQKRFFFTVLMLEKLWLGKFLIKCSVFLQHAYTIFILLISWTIFAIEDFNYLCEYFKVMFGLHIVPIWNQMTAYHLSNYGIILILAVFFATPASKIFWEKRRETL